MKFLVFIFSIYILLLPAIPCADSVNCEQIENSKTQHDQENNHEEKPCNPFCFCNCCGSIIFSYIDKIHSEDIQTSYFSKEQKAANQYFIANKMLNAIWQPPRAI
jgi:hypothetical protein